MTQSSQQRRRSKMVLIFGAFGLVAIGLTALWSVSILGRAPGQISAELKSAKADGMPIEPADLRREFSATSDDNAAPLVKAAITEFKRWQANGNGNKLFEDVRRKMKSGSLLPEQLQALNAEMPGLSRMFLLLTQAAQKPKLDFHREWERGPALMLPELADGRNCTNALLLKARCDFAGGKYQQGLEELDVVARISTLMGQEPELIALLVQDGIQAQICSLLADVIQDHATDSTSLAECKTILADLGPNPDVRWSLGAEFVSGRIAATWMAKAAGPSLFGPDNGGQVTRLSRFSSVRTVYELRFVQVYHKLYKALSERPNSIVAMRKAFADADVDLNGKTNWSYAFVKLIAPELSSLATQTGEARARRNVLQSGIAVLEARQKSGSFPARALGTSRYLAGPVYREAAHLPSLKGRVSDLQRRIRRER